MKIAVLAHNPDLYSNRRLMQAGRIRGHDMRFINVSQCYINITADNPKICYRGGEVLSDFQAVIPRIRPVDTFYGTAVVRQFEMQGVYCLNDSISILRSRDKLRTLQILSRKGINMPITGFADLPLDTTALVRMVGGAPLIVKLLEGAQGVGVVLAETNQAAESVINAFKSLRAHILVQEFIKEAEGKDLRCFLVGHKVVAAMERKAAPGEFRANLHQGGTATLAKTTKEERHMAVQAARAIGLRVAGVDIVRSKNGPKVLEVNSSPGLEGIEETTGKNIANLMIEHIEKHAINH
ncbi:MAG: 30S ribosomal protein S6--L-glutamate ligase [Gammaproteobacteria bacterium]|nr:30S ribosomal protein S6--L-glutamate ligase [Gammaproteobacteria bacterium]